jgi:hypothetical protein
LWYGRSGIEHRIAIVESYRDPWSGLIVPVRPRDALALDLPWLPGLFPQHRNFARASVPQLLATNLPELVHLRATTLASCLFLSTGSRLKHVELPTPAQWTPILGLALTDLDSDGDLDLACAQNLTATRDDDERLDAGRGLILLNDGQGRFEPLSATESGLAVYGDQRTVATADFDSDGFPDLAVAQNSGPLRVFRNRGSARARGQ